MYFPTSVQLETSETKIAIDVNKISEEVFISLILGRHIYSSEIIEQSITES